MPLPLRATTLASLLVLAPAAGGCTDDTTPSADAQATAEATAPPAARTRTVEGELESSDTPLDNGEYADSHDVKADSGDALSADLTSDAFDTYLVVFSPSGVQRDYDDFEGAKSRSVARLTADETGTWRFVVTSFEPEETGAYRMDLSVGGPAVEPTVPTGSSDARAETP